jgi:hypothetical protein
MKMEQVLPVNLLKDDKVEPPYRNKSGNCSGRKSAATSSSGSFFGSKGAPATRKTVLDFRAHFCHSAPIEMHAFGFRLPANAPKAISCSISSVTVHDLSRR